jgi:predicted lipoprotein with Yx(FWY)xxD motif
MNSIRRTHVALLALAAAAILIVSACGGSSDSGAAGSAPAGGSNATETVSVSSVDGVGKVLVDAKGAALYAADQEAGGMVVCDASCTTIWDPLTVGAGKTPSAGDGLTGKLATVKRPDGAHQVTFDGRLLYRFAEDPSAETVTGNGFADTFDGQSFTWHVVTPTGVSTSSANSSSSSSGSGYGY